MDLLPNSDAPRQKTRHSADPSMLSRRAWHRACRGLVDRLEAAMSSPVLSRTLWRKAGDPAGPPPGDAGRG
ncbi:hypothetical protein XH80_19920 [Bradyrhizobium sp. CCBAU 45384]|nr:hypothetical protein [Bradyrhizobium sp. CCBAU 45384]